MTNDDNIILFIPLSVNVLLGGKDEDRQKSDKTCVAGIAFGQFPNPGSGDAEEAEANQQEWGNFVDGIRWSGNSNEC